MSQNARGDLGVHGKATSSFTFEDRGKSSGGQLRSIGPGGNGRALVQGQPLQPDPRWGLHSRWDGATTPTRYPGIWLHKVIRLLELIDPGTPTHFRFPDHPRDNTPCIWASKASNKGFDRARFGRDEDNGSTDIPMPTPLRARF